MKHIHIVEPYHSTAMQKMSVPLTDLAKIYLLTSSPDPDPNADINYHIPFHTLIGYEKEGDSKHAMLYTHCNRGMEAQLADACQRADLIICMTFKGREELVQLGVDPSKLWVIYSAADGFQYRRRIVGIVGYPQPNGRKRESLLLDLAWQYDLSAFHILFVGKGWDETASQLHTLGVTADAIHADTPEALASVYRLMDVLLVTGYAEGGPLPLLEAMSSGVKVLSPDFGYAYDLLDADNLYSTPEELMNKLNWLTRDSIRAHKLARAWTWRDYAAEHALVFGRLLGESVDLYPERGTSRYAQLLDIIDEIKPDNIIEIGTWKGDRAIQMIQQAAKYRSIRNVFYQGCDLFESQTPEDFRAELSKAGWDEEVVQRRIDATGADAELIAGYTKDTLYKALILDDVHVAAKFYFVDGGHSEETIAHDGKIVLDALHYPPNAVAVFDDYYHAGKPEGMGCNKFIDNLDTNQYEITHLPARTLADDGREIGMVKVRRIYADVPIQRWETYAGGTTLYDEKSFSVVPPMRLADASQTTSASGYLERLAPAS